MVYAADVKEKRQYKRYQPDETQMYAKMAFADEVRIQNISLGGIAIKADRRMNIGKECSLTIESGKNVITTKGTVVWSFLSESRPDKKGNTIPIYSYGLQFINNDSREQIKGLIALIEKNNRKAVKQKEVDLQMNEFVDLSEQFKDVLEIFGH